MQPPHEVDRIELAALIGVEDSGNTATPQGHLQVPQAELHFESI